jgi:hypothetical protein
VHVTIGEAITPTGSQFNDRVILRDAVRAAIARLSGLEDPTTT